MAREENLVLLDSQCANELLLLDLTLGALIGGILTVWSYGYVDLVVTPGTVTRTITIIAPTMIMPTMANSMSRDVITPRLCGNFDPIDCIRSIYMACIYPNGFIILIH